MTIREATEKIYMLLRPLGSHCDNCKSWELCESCYKENMNLFKEEINSIMGIIKGVDCEVCTKMDAILRGHGEEKEK